MFSEQDCKVSSLVSGESSVHKPQWGEVISWWGPTGVCGPENWVGGREWDWFQKRLVSPRCREGLKITRWNTCLFLQSAHTLLNQRNISGKPQKKVLLLTQRYITRQKTRKKRLGLSTLAIRHCGEGNVRKVLKYRKNYVARELWRSFSPMFYWKVSESPGHPRLLSTLSS